jgi:hypothetical protein
MDCELKKGNSPLLFCKPNLKETEMTSDMNAHSIAKTYLFYIHNGLRYLIKSAAESTLELVRKGANGEADHISLKYDELSEENFAVLKANMGRLAGASPNFHGYKHKKHDLYINPLMGVSADEVRALHSSGQYEIQLKAKTSQLFIEENVALISKSVLASIEDSEVCVFIYKPADIVVEAISQFFNLKGFWVEHEKMPSGNVAFTLYW